MFMEDHSTYILLTTNGRGHNPCCDKRIVLLTCAIVLPVIVFSTTYMYTFGLYNVVYPRAFSFKNVPEQWLHRAITYSNYSQYREELDNNFISKKVHEIPHSGTPTAYKLVCYYNFPSNDAGSLKPNQIDPFLCTHINLAFAEVQNNTISLDESQLPALQAMVALKKTNPDLKIMLSVGGAGNNGGYPQMVVNHQNRKSFIKSVVDYVKKYGIDGIDLDWEFPSQSPDGDMFQRMHFTQLLEEIRASINRQSNQHKYLLSVAVAAPQFLIDLSYDPLYINEFVDFINVMCYDYHFFTSLTPFTGLNAPLYSTTNEKFSLSSLNINFTANYWFFKGVDKSKIIIGLPTYGHTFQLMNLRNNGIYAPATGYGKLGSSGFADYMQICTFLNQNQITPVFDMDSKSPYAMKFSEWVSFDDEQSLSFKTEYIRDNNYGGAMVYSLNSDDYKGVCSNNCLGKLIFDCKKTFPLINVIKKTLNDKNF